MPWLLRPYLHVSFFLLNLQRTLGHPGAIVGVLHSLPSPHKHTHTDAHRSRNTRQCLIDLRGETDALKKTGMYLPPLDVFPLSCTQHSSYFFFSVSCPVILFPLLCSSLYEEQLHHSVWLQLNKKSWRRRELQEESEREKRPFIKPATNWDRTKIMGSDTLMKTCYVLPLLPSFPSATRRRRRKGENKGETKREQGKA